jgi:hypothetical protein
MLIRIDTLQPWRGEILGDLRHPSNIEVLWTAEELAAVGLVKAVRFVVPEGKRAIGTPSYDKNGVETYAVEDTPSPALARKSDLDAIRELLIEKAVVSQTEIDAKRTEVKATEVRL